MRGSQQGKDVDVHIRLNKFGDFQDLIHFEILINGANDRELSNEITANFRAWNLDSNEVYYTDASGLKMTRRKLNFRSQFQLSTEHKVGPNLFPVTSAIAIIDEKS